MSSDGGRPEQPERVWPERVWPERVWYVAYGSNINRTRFLRYLEGDENHVGARDATHPLEGRFAEAPLALRFAGESQRWGGGVCFVDPNRDAMCHVRAWDISAEQFEDVFAQENRRTPGSQFDWAVLETGSTIIGSSWYSQVLTVDLPFAAPEQPALTFTWTTPLPLNPPSAAYRDTIVDGLAEHPELSPADIDAYLDHAVG